MDPAKRQDLVRIANELVLKKCPFPVLPADLDVAPLARAVDQAALYLWKDKRLLLPNFHEHVKTVAVFSDYGGEAADAGVYTYSLLITAYDGLAAIFEELNRIRSAHGLNGPVKEIGFKGLGYGPLGRALPEILRCADATVGLLFVLIVPKGCASLFASPGPAEAVKILEAHGFGSWKPNVAEKLLRITHLTAYWVSALSIPMQSVFWMTDEDAIAANEGLHINAAKLLSRLLNSYSPHEFAKVGYGKSFDKRGEQHFNDLLGVADLAAGAIEAYFTEVGRHGENAKVKATTDEILKWLCHQGFGLKKCVWKAENVDGKVHLRGLEFHSKSGLDETGSIPLFL